jgi:tricorn protease-like protein
LAQSETKQEDSAKVKKATKELPLEPAREFTIKTQEATWLSLDVSPDGKELVFDILGDLYRMPISGGKAEALSQGMPYDVHPRYSPDGKSLVFISDQSGSDNVWIVNLENKERRQLTKDENQNYFSQTGQMTANILWPLKDVEISNCTFTITKVAVEPKDRVTRTCFGGTKAVQ